MGSRVPLPLQRKAAAMRKREITWLLVYHCLNVLLNLLQESVYVLRDLSAKLVELEQEERNAK